MARAAIDEVVPESEVSENLVHVVVNMLLVLKLQQLNIELLWKAVAAGSSPIEGSTQLRESNQRLASSMEQIAAILAASSKPTDKAS